MIEFHFFLGTYWFLMVVAYKNNNLFRVSSFLWGEVCCNNMREWKNICNKISMTMLIIASLSSYEIILFILHNGITNLIVIYHTICNLIISIETISPVCICNAWIDILMYIAEKGKCFIELFFIFLWICSIVNHCGLLSRGCIYRM